MSEWQSIETAPKDGKPILIFAPDCMDDSIYVVCYRYGHWEEAGGEGYSTYDRATHWMPLPDPPK